MKSYIKCIIAVWVAIIGVTANADWTFYPEEDTLPDGKTKFVGTVTDGVVTFHVTGNKNNQLTINAQYGYFNNPDAIPDTFSIDFSVIKDAQEKDYYAVNFGYFSVNEADLAKIPADKYLLTPFRGKLTEFIAPHCTGLSGNGCFGYCAGLTKVVLSNEFSSFADRSFYYCSALIDLTPTTFSKVTTKLNISSFAGCSKLPGGLSFPECTSAGGSIFQNCTSIDNISLPKLKNISEATFSGCSNLKTLELSPGVRYIALARLGIVLLCREISFAHYWIRT
jgi:hypothetical protein